MPAEIRVALLGYVSVGKSTVLNALLQGNYSEVSMRRTTAAINFFRISNANNANKRRRIESDTATPTEATIINVSTDTKELQSPSATLEAIIGDNEELRKSNTIQERTFEVQVQEPLCDMRPDTTLVLLDIPGVNEAGSSKMYMDYVAQKWDTFDCVVVVMDAVQGVNTEEQVKLLEFVKDNTEKIRNIPVIVLGNKVDDPDDKEVAGLVGEVRGKVAQIFDVGCREQALDDVIAAAGKGEAARYPAEKSPIFVPLSARNAFLYRTAFGLSFDQFRKLDNSIIDKIGRFEVPAFKWKKYPQTQKYQVAYEAVSNESEYAARLEMTNFDKFLLVLSHVVGGKETQAALLSSQLDVAESKLSWKQPLAPQIDAICESSKGLGASTRRLKDVFVKLFEQHEAFAKQQYHQKMDLSELSKTMDQLVDFVEVLCPKILAGSSPEMVRECEETMITKMKSLVRHQCKFILDNFCRWDIKNAAFVKEDFVEWQWCAHYGYWQDPAGQSGSSTANVPPNYRSCKYWEKHGDGWKHKYTQKVITSLDHAFAKPTWQGLSPHDWKVIASSLLLCSQHDAFVEDFAKQKIELEQMLAECTAILTVAKYGQSNSNELKKLNEFMAGSFVDDAFIPSNEIKHKLVVRLSIPESPANPSHWGHLVWKYCQFMKRRASQPVA